MNSETILIITFAVILGASVLSVLNKISKSFQIATIITVLVWEYWMLGL